MAFTDPAPTIYHRARIMRLARGWSARELSERLTALGHRTSRGDVATWETRTPGCSAARLFALAAVFGVPIDYLADPDSGPCPTCLGTPPSGFTCNSCGRPANRTEEDR